MAIPPLHGIASVINAGNEEDLSEDTKELMYSILDKDVWLERYNPFYSDDLILGFTDMTFYDNTDELGIDRILNSYIDTFKRIRIGIWYL